MIDENIYNILLSSITRNMQSLNKSFCISLDALRKDIIKTHRTITLLPYYIYVIDSKHNQQKSSFDLPVMSDSELLSSLFMPKENPSFPEISMIAQDTSFLINYFENNPSELARAIVNSKNSTENIDYYYLIFQVVPSLFGYFHSSEHLSLATKFYQSVIDIIADNPKDSIRILQPFLNTPATFRYIEYVMTKFFKKIVFFQPTQNSKNKLVYEENSFETNGSILCRNKNTKMLLYYLTKGVSLLPDQILQIFRQIKIKYNDKWSIKDWYKLIFSIFINPHVTRWARSKFYNIGHNVSSFSQKNTKLNEKDIFNAPYSTIPNLYQMSTVNINSPSRSSTTKMDQINNILSNVLNESLKSDLDTFLNALCTVQSIYNPPQMYKCFNNYSIQYYVMINDLITFMELLKSCNILPSFIKFDLINEIPKKYRSILFYLNVYQTAKPNKHIQIDSPIVFPHFNVNTNLLEKFDNQVEYRSRLASLEALAESVNKDKMIFSLEKSTPDPDFHQYVSTNIFIQLSNSADMFEEYIEARRMFSDIEKWNDLSNSCKNFLFLAYLHNMLKLPAVFDLLPNKIKLLNQLSRVDEDELLQDLNKIASISGEWDGFIHRITNIDQSHEDTKQQETLQNQRSHELLPKQQKPEVSKNQKLMKNRKQKNQSKLPITKSHSSSNIQSIEQKKINFIEKMNYFDQSNQLPLFFLKALSIFSQIAVVNLPQKYELLMQFFNIIDIFFPKEDNNLYFLLIQRIPGCLLIKIFTEISTFAIHDDLCYNYIPNNERAMWQRFENLVYETASKNDALFQKILKCQIEFQSIYEAWKNSFCNKKQFTRRNRSFSLIG